MNGVDILILVDTSVTATPAYTVVGGQRGATFSEKSDTIDTTSKDSQGANEFDYGLYGWTIKADGVYVPDEAAFIKLKNAIRTKTKVKVRISEGGAPTDEGMALVTSREVDAPYDAEVTYKLELQGTGKLTVALP